MLEIKYAKSPQAQRRKFFFFLQLREKNKQGGPLRQLKKMKAPNLSSLTTPSC